MVCLGSNGRMVVGADNTTELWRPLLLFSSYYLKKRPCQRNSNPYRWIDHLSSTPFPKGPRISFVVAMVGWSISR